MKVEKEIWARAGVIWSIIGVVISGLLVFIAFSIGELNSEARTVAILVLGGTLLALLINLKAKKHINVKDRLDSR